MRCVNCSKIVTVASKKGEGWVYCKQCWDAVKEFNDRQSKRHYWHEVIIAVGAICLALAYILDMYRLM